MRSKVGQKSDGPRNPQACGDPRGSWSVRRQGSLCAARRGKSHGSHGTIIAWSMCTSA